MQLEVIGYYKMTAIHHIKYHDEDPLKDTEELCPGCHLQKSRLKHRQRRMLQRKIYDTFKQK